MACGFASIVFSLQGRFHDACMILILGAIFDSVDGRVARMTGTSSQFGEQFDSMSDLISFGVAPAILMFKKYLIFYNKLGAVVAFIFILCGALRLARFNANIEKIRSDFFQGLPIPGAATAVVGFVLFFEKFANYDQYPFIAVIYVSLYSILMITTVPFPSFKNSSYSDKQKKFGFFVGIVLAALLFSYYQVMTLVFMNLYVIISIVLYFRRRKEFGDAFQWSEDS